MFIKMLTGFVSLILSRCGRDAAQPERDVAQPEPPAKREPEVVQAVPVARSGVNGAPGMPKDRAMFIAAFLKHAFRGRTAISVFCHEDKPFPDIHVGGTVEGIDVYGSGDDWRLTFSLNHYMFFVDGHVDIEMERDAPMLRVASAAPAGARIQLVFMPEGGYSPIPDSSPPGSSRDDYDMWAKARRALDDHEYPADLFAGGPS